MSDTMDTLTTTNHAGGDSPFDRIRRTRADGSEYWPARDLMPLLGYSSWRNFQVPIDRAIQSTKNQEIDVTSNFAGSRKVVSTAGPAQADYELSRYGAYLVALNGDPNKKDVADAQHYFTIQTRRAELALSKPVQPQITYTGVPRIDGALADAALLHGFKGLIHDDHLEARAQIVLARGLGEAPVLEASTRPIYVSDFVAEQDISREDQKRILSQFGKKAKAAYIHQHGGAPAQYHQDVKGQVRQVYAYTVADRPLLEKVWREHFAPKFSVVD